MPVGTHSIDAHCHLATPSLETRLNDWILEAERSNISGWVQGGIDPADWTRQMALAQKYPAKIHLCFGLHPWMAAKMTISEIERDIKVVLQNHLPKACGLGELGLDFSTKYHEAAEPQLLAFISQLELARNFEKPLVLHVVDAHPKTLELLKKYAPYPRGGIVHSFSGALEVAKEYLKLGFTLSIGPQILRSGYQKLKTAIPLLSLEQLVVETDAPDRDFKGLLMLHEVAHAVATLKGMETEKVLQSSTANLKTIFGIRN